MKLHVVVQTSTPLAWQAMSATDAMDLLRKVLLLRQQSGKQEGAGASAAQATAATSQGSTEPAAVPVSSCWLATPCRLSMHLQACSAGA